MSRIRNRVFSEKPGFSPPVFRPTAPQLRHWPAPLSPDCPHNPGQETPAIFDLTIASKKRILAIMSDPFQPAAPGGERTPSAINLSAYRGCWVALVGEQVAGVGATAEAAQLAARRSRPRERITATLLVPNDA